MEKETKEFENEMEKKLEEYRSKIEGIVNNEYNRLSDKKLDDENDENLSGALTMMESINIDILHILRDFDDLMYYIDILKKL